MPDERGRPVAGNADRQARLRALEQQRAFLEGRLRRGERVVEEARARGDPRLPEYEALWCALLADYERLCDEIARLADETAP